MFKKYGIYKRDNKYIVAISIIAGHTYEELENKGYWKENGYKADYSIEIGNDRVALYKIDDVYYYLINSNITDPVVAYKSLEDNKGMKGMRISELEEWELIK